MSNKATKKEAVKIVSAAVKDGFNREISTMRDTVGNPWSVQVSLVKTLYFKNGYHNMSQHIIVSFRKARRGWSVSIATSSLTPGGRVWRGPFNAQYAIRQLREAAARMAGLEAK